jgi:alginate O-acetyltransferase complex protein AlgI
MDLTSINYLGFITLTFLFYRFLPLNAKPYLLIFSSFIFIGSYSIESLVFFLFQHVLIHFTVKKISTTESASIRKRMFKLGIVFIIAFIFSLKYIEIKFNNTSSFNTNKLIFFLGISFYSLQNISYLIDVYYGRVKRLSFLDFTLFSSFFSKFIAGPITIIQTFKITYIEKNNTYLIQQGINRIAWGLFKKIVIAERIAPVIAFNFELKNPTLGLTNLVLAYLFTIQLYFDFSGYSDIAIGTAKLFGIDLSENFKLSLRAKSISEFWRRWHISLSNWLTNYIFYPISYKYRKKKYWGTIIAIVITFLVSGLWHGVYLTFIIYALLHSVYLIVGLFIQKPTNRFKNRIFSIFSIFFTFNLVSISFIFFRSISIEQAFSKVKCIFSQHFFSNNLLFDFTQYIAMGGEQENVFNLYVSLFLISLVLLFEDRLQRIFNAKKMNVIHLTLILLTIIFFGVFDKSKNFIYTQF